MQIFVEMICIVFSLCDIEYFFQLTKIYFSWEKADFSNGNENFKPDYYFQIVSCVICGKRSKKNW